MNTAKERTCAEALDLYGAMKSAKTIHATALAVMLYAADDLMDPDDNELTGKVMDLLSRVEDCLMKDDDTRFTEYDLADAIAHTSGLDLDKLAALSDDDLMEAVY